MERSRIGSLEVSRVGLGCNNFGRRIDAAATARVVDAALGCGIDFFDTADVYGDGLSEEYLGKALRGRPESVAIASKFGARADGEHKRGSPEWIRIASEASLRRLGTECIDLYQIHMPDPEVPIAETLGALDELVREGKVREIGCSNFGSRHIAEARQAADDGELTRFRSVQNRYSVLTRDPEERVIPACREHGLRLIPYFPLESGLLTGKYRPGSELPPETRLAAMPEDQRGRFLSDDRLEKADRLREYAEARGHSLLELAISWLTSKPEVASVICGATKPEQVGANASSAGWQLTEAELEEIDAIVS